MSRTPYFYLERFNRKTNKYELEHPLIWNWNRTKQVSADLFPFNGCHELFSIVEDQSQYDFPHMFGIHHDMPADVSEDIKNNFENCKIEYGTGEEIKIVYPKAHWFTYADMYIYLMENPTVIDYDTEESVPVSNPIKTLKNRVDAFLEVMNEWGDWKEDYSLIRIVYWIL